jgi:hypothetical protein
MLITKALNSLKWKVRNDLTWGLLGSDDAEHLIKNEYLDIAQNLPIAEYLEQVSYTGGRVKPFEIESTTITQIYDSTINELYRDLHSTIFKLLQNTENTIANLKENFSYRMPYLLEVYGHSINETTNINLFRYLNQADQRFVPKLQLHNALTSSSNIAQYQYNHRIAQNRLVENIGPDYNPDNNFSDMEYLTIHNSKNFRTMRDIAVFFGALFRSGFRWKFDNIKIRTRRDVIDLFQDQGDGIYFLYPCSGCKRDYRVKSGTINSELNNISVLGHENQSKCETLINEIHDLMHNDEFGSFLPTRLRLISLK